MEPPTKTDLLKAIKQYENCESPAVVELRRLEQKAEKDLEKFQQTNKQYIKLTKALNDAREKRWRAWFRDDVKRKETIRECRTTIHTEGATPKATEMVRKLAVEFQNWHKFAGNYDG